MFVSAQQSMLSFLPGICLLPCPCYPPPTPLRYPPTTTIHHTPPPTRHAQRWRLAELKAEEYGFTLLSRFINCLEQQGGPGFLSSAEDGAWGLPIGACVLGVRHMGLGGWDPAECMAVEGELAAWQRQGCFVAKRDNALRCVPFFVRG